VPAIPWTHDPPVMVPFKGVPDPLLEVIVPDPSLNGK
jgi:hypothetical protein